MIGTLNCNYCWGIMTVINCNKNESFRVKKPKNNKIKKLLKHGKAFAF